ncbi:endonuclease/exonuclease/phosphatase family protein [Nesterenkonia aerolata]|uniref:Endonuclease/exonuclease/phosphatase family protein n=1 Tax=Nesterenkonia aerolata TaxID=3074079 RepID=A0ABU2DV90_9MICC|nr:endonuclease/exonuclease/phosphatase family protein [Nesterenkonia sp. LY-0111]MDR8020394.1 endonuclease/exonuclease/phosphatase family protein [Nesterenkonia sp. LY-0111]
MSPTHRARTLVLPTALALMAATFHAPTASSTGGAEPVDTAEPNGAVDAAPEDQATDEGTHRLSVLTLNMWFSGTKVSDGPAAAAAAIEETGADVVFLQESNLSTLRIARELGWEHHGLARSAAVITKYPILETDIVENTWTKAVLDVEGVEVAAYSGHLEYRFYANYLPRGYGAGAVGLQWPRDWRSWDLLEEPITDTDSLLELNAASGRLGDAAALAADVAEEGENGRLAVIGGDFNEASAQDWTEETAELFDRHGAVVPWQTTQTLLESGLSDAYREAHPDPATHPGFTWPAANPVHDPAEISWTHEADERDRIDYVFYSPDERWDLEEVRVVGPQDSVVEGQAAAEQGEDEIFTPSGTWPSDHKAVQAEFMISTEQAPDSEGTEGAQDDEEAGAH